MIIGELTFYALVALVGALATVVYAAWARGVTGRARRYMIAAPFVTAVLAAGYFGMATEALTLHDPSGEPVPVSRFVAYLFSYTLVIAYLGLLADASRRKTLLGMGALGGFVTGTMINWLSTAPLESAGKLLVLASLATLFWLMFGPYTSTARSVSEARWLAFAKQRNLLALLMLMYLVVGLTSRQGLGLLDAFSGVYLGAYMDVLGHLGFAGILLRADAAIEELAAQRPSPLDFFRDGGAGPSPTDATASD